MTVYKAYSDPSRRPIVLRLLRNLEAEAKSKITVVCKRCPKTKGGGGSSARESGK